ncbi:MAG: manganese efflux pump MntP family protein [Lachnospiraceae bacterium]|jgi:putative Mn2+ efflux pump MntP|nr:manganese efflux pump MntP family protein [Lachnospiraceae bacterium]
MSLFEIIIIAISLAMDAFAVSICKGISMKRIKWKNTCIIALYFGAFQALMPTIGYFLGTTFSAMLTSIDHWIAFVLLGIIGIKMIKESLENEKEDIDDGVGFKSMIVLAIATSIDALAVGVTFAFLNVNILFSVAMIGLITFALSIVGVNVGSKLGSKYGKIAEKIGGIVLILLGIKILFEHLNII